MDFGDHHVFTQSDVARVKDMSKGDVVVTTQKDFLRRGGVDLVKELGTVHVLEGELAIMDGLDGLQQRLHKLFDGNNSESLVKRNPPGKA